MAENKTTNEETKVETVEAVAATEAPMEAPKAEEKPATTTEAPKAEAKPAAAPRRAPARRGPGGGGDFKKNRRRPRNSRPKSEFDQKTIGIRRVTRVMAGGRRFSFSVGMVIGDRKGSVGVGVGKAGDTALAIEKAVRNAKKNMVKLPLTEERSIPHEVSAKYSSSEIMIFPAPGRGIVAGSAVRTVLDLAGVTNVTSKIVTRSKNGINIARAAIKALTELKGDVTVK